jgi:class 3 adenylate cyclase
MSEKLTPDEIVEQLNAYHGAMVEVIGRHHGVIDKFIGDGVLVIFGLGSSPEEGARAAVSCAKEMLSALDHHNAERSAHGMRALKMGIGVHTGSVVAGNIGVPGLRLEFTVIGDAVNTASRLEGLTKELGAPGIVSAKTVELLGGSPGLRELPTASVRGKADTVQVFALDHDAPIARALQHQPAS